MKKLEVIREKCNEIKSVLEKELGAKIDFMADSDGNVKFNIYANDYDYYSVNVNIYKFASICEIRDFIRFIFKNRIEELDFYKAPSIEKVITDMLEENKVENIYIMDGLLCTPNQDFEFCLKDIKEYHVYNDEECIMRIWDELDGWFIIDFDDETIIEESN